MYNKDLDFYVPLFVSDIDREGYYYISDKIKLSNEQLDDLRNIWKTDDSFDGSFSDFLDQLFIE